jgi:protein-glutamine gamma-glutamyltransferase
MINIDGNTIPAESINGDYPENSIERVIINKLAASNTTYSYSSIYQLKFEINLRINIINASKELDESSFHFKTFRKSMCNEDFWKRTEEGGFLLKDDVSPFDGIKDIFVSSSKYGNECATAMVIVFLKAIHNVFNKELFNRTFPKIQLMDWQYVSEELGLRTYRKSEDYFPSDCRYFRNPEVDPETPEWQGENVIDLGNDTYYGHGIGIKDAEGIIASLNKHRIKDAKESAYLLDTVTRLNFANIFRIYENYSAQNIE